MSVAPLALVILLAGAWAYSTSFRGEFVLDDVRAIVRNPTIRSLWPLSIPMQPPTGSTVAGRPVANLSFALNHALAPRAPTAGSGGQKGTSGAETLDPAPYHAGNLLIHLCAALVLFGVVRRTLQRQPLQSRFGSASSWLALVVALIWVVHPLQTASVTYIVQRVESLMGFFYLLTLYCAIRALVDVGPRWWTAAAIASCACGMATKEVMVTAPIIVAIWWRLFGEPKEDNSGPTRWRLMAGLASTWIVLGSLVANEQRGPSVSVAWETVWPYLFTQAAVIVHYVRLALLPSPLVFLYDWPLVAAFSAVAWQAALLTAFVIATAMGVARRHPASFLGAWFFLILAPSSSVLPIVTEVAAEHRMYLPLASIVVAAVLAVYVLGRRWVPSPRAAAVVAILAALASTGALGVGTRQRNQVYWSAEALWHDTVSTRPNDARARVAYGEALAGAGRLAEAEAQLQAGMTLAPDDRFGRVRLGTVLAQQRKYDEAVPHLERALALHPGDVDAHRFLGLIYAAQRRDALAARHYEQALASLPETSPLALQLTARLAAILADSGDVSVKNAVRAMELAGRAVRVTTGRDPRMLEVLSAAQAAAGLFAEAAATAHSAAGVARGLGDVALASALEYRASAYEQAARQAPFGGPDPFSRARQVPPPEK